jgi:hypothetical protein
MNRPSYSSRTVPAAVLCAVALLVALVTGGGATTASAHPDTAHHAHARHVLTGRQVAFHDQMRRLWEDHVTWTRLAIVSFADGSDGFPATADRLLRNQADLGAAIEPFYGPRAGDRLTALLRDHITIAVDLLRAAKGGDTAAFEAARTLWYANSDQVADHLSSLNPTAWPRPVVRAMMRTHLNQTLTEAVDELTGDYAGSVAAYDAIHSHILTMADTLSVGIIDQFPRRFR